MKPAGVLADLANLNGACVDLANLNEDLFSRTFFASCVGGGLNKAGGDLKSEAGWNLLNEFPGWVQ